MAPAFPLVKESFEGNECGGIALANPDKKTGVRAPAFDYSNNDAIGLMTQEDLDGKSSRSGFAINDKRPGQLGIPLGAPNIVKMPCSIVFDNGKRFSLTVMLT